MRLWSLHPQYLDTKGLVALWRESLLAKHVLEGKTKGYTQHPQLLRFKKMSSPIDAINQYLSEVHKESLLRGYHFDKNKISIFKPVKINVTKGQLAYEQNHLLQKLKLRDPVRYANLKKQTKWLPCPIFKVIDGDVEPWEIIS